MTAFMPPWAEPSLQENHYNVAGTDHRRGQDEHIRAGRAGVFTPGVADGLRWIQPTDNGPGPAKKRQGRGVSSQRRGIVPGTEKANERGGDGANDHHDGQANP